MLIEPNGFFLSIATEANGVLHRTTLGPGDSLTGQPQAVLDAAAELWTPEVLTEWAAMNPAPDPVEALAAWRAAAFMSKAAFLKALVAGTILSAADAIAAARGEVPASFAGIIDAMPEADRVEAQIEWGAVVNVTRANPFINAVAVAAGVNAATLDTIFGWQG